MKMELIDILATIRTKLQDFKEMIAYKVQKLKKSIDENAINKFCLNMNPIVKILVGISFISAICLGGYLGFAVHNMMPPASSFMTGVRAVGLTSFGAALGFGVALVTADLIYSFWQACKNKEKF